MHPQFLDRLCCPETGEPLTLRAETVAANGAVLSGALTTASGRSYPILRGIPRFVQAEHYAASFGYEWTRWPRLQFEDQNVGRPMEGHTTRMWTTITAAQPAEVRGTTVVEFGCGPGRFLDVVRRQGGLAVGLDISLAVESARRNFADDPGVLIVQGDLLQPPFRPGVFDGGYSIGVLHHTPDPARGLASLARAVRPGGWVSVCVYPRGEFYDYESVARFRRLLNRLAPEARYRLAYAYASLSAYVLSPGLALLGRLPGLRGLVEAMARRWLVVLRLPDARWSVLDIFDAITPAIATTHTEAEVHGWLAQAACREARTTGWCATSARGLKA